MLAVLSVLIQQPRHIKRDRVIGEAAPQIVIGLFSLHSMGVMFHEMRTKVFFVVATFLAAGPRLK
jgi:hypothetical protein